MATEPFLLTGTNPAILPKNIAQDIWNNVQVKSIIPALSTQMPVIFGDNVVPQVSGRPAAGIVGEGQVRPGGEFKLDAKTFRPVTAAVIVELSKQSIKANPSGMLTELETVLTRAITNQVDLAVIHGRNAATGAQLTSGAPYLNQATQRIELAANDATLYDKQLWDGYEEVIGGASTNFTGFAFDNRFAAALGNARDSLGRRLNPEISMGVDGVREYSGQPVVVSKGVSGQVDFSADTHVRAIGGDWDALRFGFNESIMLTPIPYGDPLGNGDLVSRGMTAFMAEVSFGWTVMDLNSFVVYEVPAA